MITFPNAKINIGLHIINRREDGFHNIETVFYPTQWCDVLEIVVAEDAQPAFVTTGTQVECPQDDNLVIKAYHMLSKDFSLPDIQVHLHKLLPMGAGLGGGSSDAAYTIKALDKICDLRLDAIEQQHYARKLGSDCAFFIENKPVYATEKGDKFEALVLNLTGFWLTIIYPNIPVSTADAYRTVHPRGSESKIPSLKDLVRLPVQEWKHHIFNDFETPVFRKYPEIQNIKEKMYQSGALYASMSGSGSAVYGLFENKPKLGKLATRYLIWHQML